MDRKKQIDDLVAMLDSFVATGGGHMNVKVEDDLHLEQVDVTTMNSNSCGENMACQIPTLHKGLEDLEEEEW